MSDKERSRLDGEDKEAAEEPAAAERGPTLAVALKSATLSTPARDPALEGHREAEADPLAPHAAGILSHMNEDHADTLLAYARALAGEPLAEEAVMTGVDQYGFEMRVRTPGGERPLRLGFDPPATTTDEVRRAMIALARAAREKGIAR